MTIGLLVITMEAQGEEWSNTFGVGDPTEPLGPLSEAALGNLVSGVQFGAEGATNPNAGGGTYQGANNLVASVIGFMRTITFAPARVVRAYISDGEKNSGANGGGSVFWTQNLNLACLRGGLNNNANEVAPLSIAWLIKRNPAGFSRRPGRLYLRHALPESEIKPGSRDGVTWVSGASAEANAGALAGVVTGSQIGTWFGDGTGNPGGGLILGIPIYGSSASAQAGEVVALAPISSFSSGDPVSRQLTRGRRKKVST